MSLWRAAAALSSAFLVWTANATGRFGTGKSGSWTGTSRSQSVSPVWASLSFMRTTMSPGPASLTSAVCAPSVL